MKTFLFKIAFKETIAFTINNIANLFKSTLPLIIVYGIIQYFILDAVNNNQNHLAMFIGSLEQFLLLIMFTVTWGGFYLKKIKTISFADVSNWHQVKTAYLITSIKLFLITLGFMFFLSIPLIMINGFYDGGRIANLFLIIIIIIIFAILSRLSVVFGYCITTGKADILHILKLTKNNTVKLSLSYLALLFPVMFINVIIQQTIVISPVLNIILSSILVFIINAILTVYHINVYKQLTK